MALNNLAFWILITCSDKQACEPIINIYTR
jgi:hypothetical protein